MMPYFGEIYGNPHSRNHSFGWEAEEGVEVAREHVAKIINANPKEIIFAEKIFETDNVKKLAYLKKIIISPNSNIDSLCL